MTDTAPASNDTPMPAYANDRRNASGKTSRAEREMATVTALNATVLPAVCTVRTTALCGSRPARSSSRYRETTNRL